MLARLQQGVTIGLALLALAAVWTGIHLGHAAAGVAVAAFFMLGHSVVLGIEFMLVRRVHGDDRQTRRATRRELLRAWAGEVFAAMRVFCWRQPFRSRAVADRLTGDMRGRRGVLLVHGFVCNRGIWNPWLARLHAAGVPFIAVDLEPVFGSLDDYAHTIEAAVRRLEDATGLAPVVVAHSMGGLVLRRWWIENDPARLHHAVTIGTPHHGTWLARFALSPSARQMRYRSAWVQALARRESRARAARWTCFYGNCDNIVFPAAAATLPGADNRHLAGVGHVHMVERPEPFDALMRLL